MSICQHIPVINSKKVSKRTWIWILIAYRRYVRMTLIHKDQEISPHLSPEKWAATWQNQQCGCVPSEDSVWSESSLSAWRNLGSLATHWAHSEDSEQTGRMLRLIRVFAGHTVTLLVLSCRGSLVNLATPSSASSAKEIRQSGSALKSLHYKSHFDFLQNHYCVNVLCYCHNVCCMFLLVIYTMK